MKLCRKILSVGVLFGIVFAAACGGGGGGGGGGGSGPSAKGSTSFEENWESASPGSYSPAAAIPLINADEGDWIIGDTVSEFPECGTTPHVAKIIASTSGQALQLVSNDSGSSCSDNIWVVLMDVPAGPINSGFSIPIDVNTRISFDETGSLLNPQTGSSLCLVKPCGDTIALMMTDNKGNVLAYILQRAPAATVDTSLSQYREIFLDPSAGNYKRNIYADFASIPNFVASGAKIVSIEFKVQEHGQATLDNLKIFEKEPTSSTGPVTVTASDLVGVWRRLDAGQTNKGKEYLANGTGWLGNFNTGTFTRGTPLTWNLSGTTLTDYRVDGTRVETVVEFGTGTMKTQRTDNGNFLNWEKQ